MIVFCMSTFSFLLFALKKLQAYYGGDRCATFEQYYRCYPVSFIDKVRSLIRPLAVYGACNFLLIVAREKIFKFEDSIFFPQMLELFYSQWSMYPLGFVLLLVLIIQCPIGLWSLAIDCLLYWVVSDIGAFFMCIDIAIFYKNIFKCARDSKY